MSMKKQIDRSIVRELKPILKEAGIEHRVEKDAILIPLPNAFGYLEITSLSDTDDLIGLVDQDWHFQTSWMETDTEEVTSLEKVMHFIQEIFAGGYYLIEEETPGQQPTRLIEDDLEGYESELPNGVEFKVIHGG